MSRRRRRYRRNPVRGVGIRLSTAAFLIAGYFAVKGILAAKKGAEAIAKRQAEAQGMLPE